MKLTWFPSSPDRIKKYSKQRRQTVVGGGANDEGKRTPALEDQKTTGNWFKDEMGKYSPRRSNAPRTAPDSLPIQTQRNLPRDSYGPTFNPFAQSAVFAPQPPLTTSTSSLVCNEDDALRGLLRFSNEAHTFCPLFLGPRIDGHRLATYIGQYDPAQVSSACSCFESKLSTGCCTLTATTSQQSPTPPPLPQTTIEPPSPASVQSKSSSSLQQTTESSSSSSRDLVIGDATSSRPSGYWGPITDEVTHTAMGQEPISVSSTSSAPNQRITLVNAPATMESITMTLKVPASTANTDVADPTVWLEGGNVLTPAVVAAIVCSDF